MNLEKEVEKECFFTKFGRWGRKLILPWIATSIFTLGCEEGINGPDDKKPKQETVLTNSTTNEQGRTYFVDNQTKEAVPVQVRNAKTKSPISSVSIEYLDGEDFKTYLVEPNEKYFPAVFVYPHNSEKILDLGEIVLKAFINQVIQGEEEHKALYSWKSEVTNNWANYYYVDTISKDEVLEIKEAEYAAFDLAAEIATLKINYNPIPEGYSLSDIIKFLDAKKYFKDGVIAERWDIYHIDWGRKLHNGKTIQFGADNFDMIPSNIPTLILYNPKVEGNKMNITWKGDDKTTYNLNYFYESQHFPQKDLTITQGSNPNKADLTYFYKVTKNGSIYIDWKSTVATDLGLSDLADGNYILYLYVKDEVENYSDIKSVSFSPKAQTKSFNIFDYLTLTEGSYGNYTNDYYAKVVDVVDYNGKTIGIIENPNSAEFLWISSSAVYLFGINVGGNSGYNMFFNPPAKMGDSKMEIGDSFNNSFYIYSDIDYNERIGNGKDNWEYLRFETVTVPAGTFKDCLVTREYAEVNIGDYSSSAYAYNWLAKGIGSVKFKGPDGTIYELRNYSVK